MFYIVETKDQLDKIISYEGNEKVFIDVIPIDERIHSCINTPSLLYFRPLTAKRGFIIAINHIETFSLPYEEVLDILVNKIPEIYTLDTKRLLHFGIKNSVIKGLKLAYTLNLDYPEFPDNSKFDTNAHKFYYTRLKNRIDVNRFIPISKHYEKYENLFDSLIINDDHLTGVDYDLYNRIGSAAFCEIEKNGIGLDDKLFNNTHPGFNKNLSIKDNKIYSQYNFGNQTARPSCNFNGFNFLGIKKGESRNILIPKNDIFVEYDYKSYQVKLLADLLNYKFEEDNIHIHLMKEYGEEDYDTAKGLTFKYLYGRGENPPDIQFFKDVYALRDYLWEEYQEKGYIVSPNIGRKIFGITEITQILPYFMQAIETETNIQTAFNITKLLKDYKTKLILYSYDAFLFDLSYQDPNNILQLIETELSAVNCTFTLSSGYSYGDLSLVPSCT
jgi:hypothetical protein